LVRIPVKEYAPAFHPSGAIAFTPPVANF